jgi:CRISPR-associated protein Cmr2
MPSPDTSILIALTWCLAWGRDRSPQHQSNVLEKFRNDLRKGRPVAADLQRYLNQAKQLQSIAPDAEFPATLEELKAQHSELWAEETPIGLVYGGATKIKQYVFEGNNLQDIRGASALLDRINLVDLPGFFTPGHKAYTWLQEKFSDLATALIPELVIYATGGNILAFCPAAFVDDLANAIEQRYTEETLSANSCAVGDRFRLLELHYGQLPKADQRLFWLNDYLDQGSDSILQAYFSQSANTPSAQDFIDRKSFSELVTHLASRFNQRRGGMTSSNRPSRRFPPMFETHPYLQRDDNDRRSAIARVEKLPSRPKVSSTSARKRIVGQLSKREDTTAQWFTPLDLDWQPNSSEFISWVLRFEEFLNHSDNQSLKTHYYQTSSPQPISEARSLPEIGDTSTPKGFIAHLYADGNNMGGYIQKQIKSPQAYQEFSNDVLNAMQQSVYYALAKHLQVRTTTRSTENSTKTTQAWIHPFEILALGGDDVSLIVPADQALAIAQTIGEKFEEILVQHPKYQTQQSYNLEQVHRYKSASLENPSLQSVLSLSIGVLLCADNTPIYYAQSLVEQLLKSAKKYAKDLGQKGYYGGTIDFLVMKSVTMISSNLKEFRAQALTKASLKLKLYAAPYTLHEIGGLLKTVKALKQSDFPTSQLYQLRSLLEQGRRTAILNYRYFRARLNSKGDVLKQDFEDAWCRAKQNDGNLAPWISILKSENTQDTTGATYETIWRDLVDLLPFTPGAKSTHPSKATQSAYKHKPLTPDRSPRR